jgi:hypothetical protein
VFLGCVLSKDSKTLCHYSLKALQIYQNHLRLSFYMPYANTKKQKNRGGAKHLLYFFGIKDFTLAISTSPNSDLVCL